MILNYKLLTIIISLKSVHFRLVYSIFIPYFSFSIKNYNNFIKIGIKLVNDNIVQSIENT